MELDKYGKAEFFASCAKGLSAILARELEALGISGVRPLASGVSFRATVEQACRCLLWLRTASRVAMVLARVGASTSDELYDGCRDIDWGEHILPESTIAVFAKGSNSALRNSHFVQQRVKDAICDRLLDDEGRRPSVDAKNPDVGISVNVHKSKATISLDLSGKPMHMRGFRQQMGQVEAPIKETLAAAVLLTAGWDEIAKEGGAFADPFCGGGTFAIEAAMIAANIAPGIARQRWGIQGWRQFDQRILDSLVGEADDLAEEGVAHMPQVFASDASKEAVKIALANVKLAGLAGKVQVQKHDISDLRIPGIAELGLVAANPPYGERIMSASQLPSLLGAMRSFADACGDGWRMAVVVPDPAADFALGREPCKVVETFNGPIEVSIRVYPSASELKAARRVASGAAGEAKDPPGANVAQGRSGNRAVACGNAGGTAGGSSIDAQTQEFANRLRKMAKHRGKWARRTGVGCYRVYDADLPDFALSVDVYTGVGRDNGRRWAYICEYAPPKTIDPDVAARRAASAVNVVREQFELGAGDVFLKRRVRSKGGSQYGAVGGGGAAEEGADRTRYRTIEEGGHRFLVSFEQKIDTGIFLDSRNIRSMLEQMSAGKRFANLFAYTGTATVYAAAGGAASTHTVDMSQTYLGWARKNMQANGFKGEEHTFERADVLSWVDATRHSPLRFDLVYVDPPTFSNSKSMGGRSWDVQRDHAELLIGVSRILAPGGKAVFCCNLRSFKPDIQTLAHAGVALEDVSAQTIPVDFERNRKIHHCYILTRTTPLGVPAGSTRPVDK